MIVGLELQSQPPDLQGGGRGEGLLGELVIESVTNDGIYQAFVVKSP